MIKEFDIGILGAGVAGASALLRVLTENKTAKVLVLDAGRPAQKRRHQVFGFLGGFPGSDGKLYVNNFKPVSDLAGAKKANNAKKWLHSQLSNALDLTLKHDNKISVSGEKRIKKNDYSIKYNDHYQLAPKDIHSFSKYIVSYLDNAENIHCSFDNEIFKVIKNKTNFLIETEEEEFYCKKIIVCTGRAGWRWTSDLYSNFGIIEENNKFQFGIKAEISSTHMKDFNEANCVLSKNDIDIGPLSWNGTVIPEDHIDMAITSFRSNESRWHSDKVSFDILKTFEMDSQGYQQADRISKLTFILANDRVMKEKTSLLLNDRSKISVMKEYDWLKESLLDIDNIIPEFTDKSYFYSPTVVPVTAKINIGENFDTEVNGMYCAGESAGVPGIYGALLSGMLAADGALNG